MTGRLATRLTDWPAVRRSRSGRGAATTFTVTPRAGHTIHLLHLHGHHEAELCLTWPVIERLGDTLRRSGPVRVQPGDDWIRLRLDGESDISLALTLISLAIHAAADAATRTGLPPCSCRTATTRH